ncbi:MAG TPA: shikimate dehydrogenase [Candidatus Dormibacteraeota bacterium]|nr:shikimate dehydrogenase [Candidatus Dormibacteraeota bacterium]
MGDPVSHSLSPAIQSAAFAALDLDWQYRLVPVPEGDLEQLWPDLAQRFLGINVTSPHKQTAARLADSLSPTAQLCASVNTVTFGTEGSFGDSTDGAGFLAALRLGGGGLPGRAVLMGTGGAARAVAAALLEEGTEVLIVGRNQGQGRKLERELGQVGAGKVSFRGDGPEVTAQSLVGAGLLVNATLLGGVRYPQLSPIPDCVPLSPDLVVFDLVYWPRATPLGRRARAEGCRLVDGLEMLVEQGALSFQAWTGIEPPIPEMRRAAQRAMEVFA